MKQWDFNKLEQMSEMDNEYTSIRLNYVYIADNFEEIVKVSSSGADLVPLMFEDVKVAYPGDPLDDVDVVRGSETEEVLAEKARQRNVVHIKHFSRGMSHEDWFKFLEDEVLEFLERYPEFSDALL